MLEAEISHVSCSGNLTFAAVGNSVKACLRDVTVSLLDSLDAV